jgi:DNA polymerase-4
MGARKIIHVDMDAFFAAVEQRDNPRFRGKPVIVGGDPNRRGVVATASYEARRFGIHSAMPCAWAYRRCPHAIFIRPRFEVYRQVSKQVQRLLRDYSELVEPLSLDEAYVDLSDSRRHGGSATRIAQEIRRRIVEDTGLTASAGVSYNKFLAKLASDLDKPDGLTVITPEQGPAFAAALEIGKFHGIGRATERRMRALGIVTGADLCQWPLERLQESFGKSARYYYDAARGIDDRPVQNRRERKSIGSETTFDQDLADKDEMISVLERLASDVLTSLKARGLWARTLTIKVRYADFESITRSRTLDDPIRDMETLKPWLAFLLAKTEAGERRVRLLGVTASGLSDESLDSARAQMDLFDDTE